MRAMIVAVAVISCLVSSWMISHLGKKPVNGGSPARESRANIRVVLSVGVFVHAVITIDRFRALVVFKVRNTVVVIREYR